jgi:hypothetical protein
MHTLLVVVGLALTLIGYAVERQNSGRFTRGKAVGLSLFVLVRSCCSESACGGGCSGSQSPHS